MYHYKWSLSRREITHKSHSEYSEYQATEMLPYNPYAVKESLKW